MTPAPRPHIAAMAPYALAELTPGHKEAPVSLAQNESLRPPSPAVGEAVHRALSDAALYPDPDWHALRHAIAEVHGIEPGAILCGAGSMELIGALACAYLGPGRRAVTSEYGYLFFRTAAALAGAEVAIVPEPGLRVDVDRLIDAASPETAVVFIANPGNPTGTVIPGAEIRRLRDELPEHTLLIVDEAYGEFAYGAAAGVFDLVERGNTIVLRTLSKAYGLAGMRVGWGIFPPDVAIQMRKVLNPNNVSVLSQAAATVALADQTYMRQTVVETALIREAFTAIVRGLGIDVMESRTNFVLLRFASAAVAHHADLTLRREGLILRPMGGYGLADCLRATIGDEPVMRRVGAVLAEALREGKR